jgi:hypothetical protein
VRRRRMPAAAATPTHGEQAGRGPATPATGVHRLFLCFSFFFEGCEDPLLLLPGPRSCVLTRPRGTDARGAGTGSGGRTQHTEGSQQQRTTRRPTSSPEKGTRESLAERRCGRWGDRWSGPGKRHRRTSSYERRRAALCGPVRRTRSGSAAVPVAVPHGAPPPAARALGLVTGAVDYS